MNKDFNRWNFYKKRLDKKQVDIFFRRREIRWCTIGEPRVAIIGQLRVFDARRLTILIDMISPEEFFPIIKAVQNLIEPLPLFPPQAGHALPGQNFSDPEANT
jgi:hypothetical protein